MSLYLAYVKLPSYVFIFSVCEINPRMSLYLAYVKLPSHVFISCVCEINPRMSLYLCYFQTCIHKYPDEYQPLYVCILYILWFHLPLYVCISCVSISSFTPVCILYILWCLCIFTPICMYILCMYVQYPPLTCEGPKTDRLSKL